MIKLLDEIPEDNIPSIIQDPFAKNKIHGISIHASKSIIDDSFSFRGNVEFKNGNTEGCQKFTGSSMDDLYLKISIFCKSLE